MVLYATGVLGGLVSALGALVGGYIADRMNRRLAYVIFGLVTSLCAIAMIVGPANPTTFTLGCLAYSFANGLCFATFYAFVFEMVGNGHGATTKLALFISASNQAINYVTWLDGKSYDWGKAIWAGRAWAGRTGMLGMDALSTFVGIAGPRGDDGRGREGSGRRKRQPSRREKNVAPQLPLSDPHRPPSPRVSARSMLPRWSPLLWPAFPSPVASSSAGSATSSSSRGRMRRSPWPTPSPTRHQCPPAMQARLRTWAPTTPRAAMRSTS